jgi:2-polyprenyl-3-methyl-5-hydroxy-6-metoxy-1,4-benzoquinol methylase
MPEGYANAMKFTPDQFNKLRKAYEEGSNLTELISGWGNPIDLETISFIYDLQSGTYTRNAIQNAEYIDIFTSEIAGVLSRYLTGDMTLLDCGTGEGTTFIPILNKLGINHGHAIDASLSRVLWANQNANNSGLALSLAVSDLGNLPFGDNSVDGIITVHALEPNGGREQLLIKELGRVAREYLFIIEPDFENASHEQQMRMTRLGYVRGLDEAITLNGFEVLEKLPIENNWNLLNSASLTVVRTSNAGSGQAALEWVDPIYKKTLKPYLNGLRSDEGFWYPIVGSIPLLREMDAQYLLSPPD